MDCVADVPAILGESPVWVAAENALYWTDIEGQRVYRQVGWGGQVLDWPAPFRICSLAQRRGGGFVAGTDQGLFFADIKRLHYEPIANPEHDLPTNRFNDGKVDRSGRFWAGTMDGTEKSAQGSLYRLDPDLSLTRVDEGYSVTNGPAFSPDGRTMYHNDSGRQVTYAFDLDEAGNASNRRVFARYGPGDGYPDGMTVDGEGCLWIAFWDGWCVRRLSPEGEIVQVLRAPVARPTSCVFGGAHMDILYITSARRGLDAQALSAQPQAGGLFSSMTEVKGIPETPFAG